MNINSTGFVDVMFTKPFIFKKLPNRSQFESPLSNFRVPIPRVDRSSKFESWTELNKYREKKKWQQNKWRKFKENYRC